MQNQACTLESNSGLPSPPDSSPSGSFETTSKATTDHALAKQEGGSHYKALAIQPIEYIHANGIGFFEGNVIKYVTRWRAKAGVEDLRKAKHYIELLIELESRGAK